ncbi:MAG: MmgE/PrpD family protein [Proteobacteria bacterium]|nr:MmgE/PrpD family protein [Pseudomonadota bacterium]
MTSLIEQLAAFAAQTSYDSLPPQVVAECKRDILDAIGCALAAKDQPKARQGIACGASIGGTDGPASVIGTGRRSSIFGAAFANGEMINTLDADSVMPPGHVSPYVLPGALAVAESRGRSGQDLIAAVAVSHEMSVRFGLIMDQTRDHQDGKATTAPVLGYSASIFGATASAAKLHGQQASEIANSLGIAAAISPVNAHGAWLRHSPPSTIKYLMAGALAQSALTAAEMGGLGHRGDLQLLDDVEFGYPRFIGTRRWQSEGLVQGLGSDWLFPSRLLFKPYPHCRVMHAPLDILIDLVQRHDIKVDEIESITSWGEAWAYVLPSFTFRDIHLVQDAQFNFAHGLAVAAHRIAPGPRWQDPQVVFDPSVMALRERVRLEIHPDAVGAMAHNASSRPSRVAIRARGQEFIGERQFPKGTPSPDPATYMSDAELADKFRRFTEGLVTPATADRAIDTLLNLENVPDFAAVMRSLVWANPKD